MAENPKTPAPAAPKAPAPSAGRQSPFDALRSEIDRLFDMVNPGDWRFPTMGPSGFEMRLPQMPDWKLAPAMDLVETDKGYAITAELPGLEEKDVDLKVANGILTIKGEKSEQKEEHKGDYHLSERRFGQFQRAFRIPEGVDADRIDASMAKGVLTVTLPKSEKAKAEEKKIEIRKS